MTTDEKLYFILGAIIGMMVMYVIATVFMVAIGAL